MAIVRVSGNFESGEEYLRNLNEEADRHFKIFLALRSKGTWSSTIDGPNYAREIKSMALSLARIRLSLDQVRTDTYFKSTTSEFIYQVVTSMLFPGPKGAPDPNLPDQEFREFLQKVVSIYFAGSIPDSIKATTELFTVGATVIVRENFKEARTAGSGFDISDEFGFIVDVVLPNPGSIDVFLADRNIRLMLDIVRPAHTLYRLKYIIKDGYDGQRTPTQPFQVLDSEKFDIRNFGYEDFRAFTGGVAGIDRLGTKVPIRVFQESHTGSEF